MGIARSNALWSGLLFLPSENTQVSADGDVVFAAQPTVPAGRLERLYTLTRLIDMARRHPGHNFVLKPRHRPGESTLHKVRYHYVNLLAPNNRAM